MDTEALKDVGEDGLVQATLPLEGMITSSTLQGFQPLLSVFSDLLL